MFGIQWGDLSFLGAFAAGLLVGIVVTVRLAKILAEFLRREREK